METLMRTKVGRFTLDDAITLAQTEEAVKERRDRKQGSWH